MSNSVRPHRRRPTRLLHPWDSPGKNTGVGCHFLLQCMKVKVKVKSLSHVRLLATPWTAAYHAPPSMGYSRQEYWSGVQLPSPKWLTIRRQMPPSQTEVCYREWKADSHFTYKYGGAETFSCCVWNDTFRWETRLVFPAVGWGWRSRSIQGWRW